MDNKSDDTVNDPGPIEEGVHREGGKVIGCWSIWRREDAAAQGIDLVCEPADEVGIFSFYCVDCCGDGVCGQQDQQDLLD